ncbi:zinc finger protein 830-like [Macrosteles quadrilineatus]|nr:zinc finger protein 830-like [Macrosteles quadrilineatus]
MDTEDASFVDSKDPLPEGFFDDPIMDAKARNVEYKDPIQEEWEKFQKEIKEETSVSTQIIEDDQEEATTERQIQEIDEQLRNWSRVLDLEKKKETVQAVATKGSSENAREDASDDEEDFDEFLDWRAKKSFK